MNIRIQSVMIASLIGVSINSALACGRPNFANDVTLPLQRKEVFIRENFVKMPGSSNRCIFSAVWVSERIELGGNIKVYVATYIQDENKKISDMTIDTAAEMIWFAPETHVDKAIFNINNSVAAFGIRTASIFLGGTFGEDKEQFDLILDDGKGKLRSVLSAIASSSYQRDCGRNNCDADDVRNVPVLIINENKTYNFSDIVVKHYELRSQPTQRHKDRRKLLKSETYKWNGEKYVSQ